MAQGKIKIKIVAIGITRFNSIVEESEIQERVALEGALIYSATHPDLGNVALIEGGGEQYGMVQFEQ